MPNKLCQDFVIFLNVLSPYGSEARELGAR